MINTKIVKITINIQISVPEKGMFANNSFITRINKPCIRYIP